MGVSSVPLWVSSALSQVSFAPMWGVTCAFVGVICAFLGVICAFAGVICAFAGVVCAIVGVVLTFTGVVCACVVAVVSAGCESKTHEYFTR